MHAAPPAIAPPPAPPLPIPPLPASLSDAPKDSSPLGSWLPSIFGNSKNDSAIVANPRSAIVCGGCARSHDLVHLICGHGLCGPCWSRFFVNKIRGKPTLLTFRCPGIDCQRTVPEWFFRAHAPPELVTYVNNLRLGRASAAMHSGPVASSPGHVFVVLGDVRRISCDAWLVPCVAHRGYVARKPALALIAHAAAPARCQ